MLFTNPGTVLISAALLSHLGCLVLGIRPRSSNEQAVDTDTNSFMETSKVVLKTNSRTNSDDMHVLKESAAPPSDRLEGGFGEEIEGFTENPIGGEGAGAMVKEAVANVLPTSALMQTADDFSRLSAASAKQLDDLYMKINARVDPEFIRQLRVRTPEIIRELKLNQKGPLQYPHMHVVNHKIISKQSRKPIGFVPKDATAADDKMTLVIVCFALVGLSSYFNVLQKKGGKAAYSNHELPDLHHGSLGDQKKLSVWDGTVTTFTSIWGMGFLSLPYAMSLAGWIAGPLMVFFTICAGYTGHLLTWALSEAIENAHARGMKVPALPGWGFLLGVAYGQKAERWVNTFLIVELWGYCLSGIVATALNLNQLVDEISVSTAVGLTVLVQFVLTNVPMKTLTKINVVSNVVFLVCCFMFIVTGLLLPAKAPASDLKWVKPEGLLAACGIIVFSPCAHSLFPAMMQRMEKPKEYPMCIRRAFALATVAYVCFAVPGYYFFGNAVQPSAVMNIGADLTLVPLPNLGWMNSVAAFCMVMKMSGLQPLILTPLNATLESMMQGFAPQAVLSTMIPPVVLAVSAVVATHFAHQMAALLNLVGSIFCMSIAFVLPVLCYWKLRMPDIGKLQQAVFAGLIMMGGTFALLGLITALAI